MYEYDAGMAFIDLQQAQDFFGLGDRVTALEVKVRDMYRAPEIADEILVALGGFPYRTNDWIEMNANLFSWMQTEKRVMFVILALIVMVAAFNIARVQIMLVKEKRRDIGILRSMGATEGAIRPSFVLEGVVDRRGRAWRWGRRAGSSSATCWSATSSSASRATSTSSTRCRCGSRGWTSGRSRWPCWLLSILATLYPAWWAARFDPVEAIRHE